MTRRGTTIATATLTTAVAVALAGQAWAVTANPAKRTLGVVLDCSTQSGLGGAPGGTFTTNRRNLVIGPLAMTGAAVTPAGAPPDFRGNKFPLIMRGGHRVTLAISRHTPDARLLYGQRRGRVFTFVSCRRDAFKPNPHEPHTACCFSFWAGGIEADASHCVHLLAWVDDERSPRRAVIRLGAEGCG